MDNCNLNAMSMATKLHERYNDQLQAITTIGQCMTKALFAGKAKTVVFWALVHAHYRALSPDGSAEWSIPKLCEIVPSDPN